MSCHNIIIQDGETAIFFAARSGNEDIIKLLVNHGAAVDIRNMVTSIVLK